MTSQLSGRERDLLSIAPFLAKPSEHCSPKIPISIRRCAVRYHPNSGKIYELGEFGIRVNHSRIVYLVCDETGLLPMHYAILENPKSRVHMDKGLKIVFEKIQESREIFY